MALKDKIFMSCEGATSLVEKKRDGKLRMAERIGLWIHLAYCKLCVLFFKQSKILDESVRSYSEKISREEKTFTLNPVRKEALKAALDKELKNNR